MTEMLLKLMELNQHQTEIVDKCWQYYCTVTLAVVGLAFGSEKVRGSRTLRLVLFAGYALFAVGNLDALLGAQKTAINMIILLNIEMTNAHLDKIVNLRDAFPIWQLASLHIAISIVVLAAILISNKIPISGSKTGNNLADV